MALTPSVPTFRLEALKDAVPWVRLALPSTIAVHERDLSSGKASVAGYGTPQSQAFQQIFGDPKTFEQSLSAYRSRIAVTAGVLPPMGGLDTKTFPARVLTAAEADYEIGSFDIGAHQQAEGKTRLQAAELADPSPGRSS